MAAGKSRSARSGAGAALARARWGAPQGPAFAEEAEEYPCDCELCPRSGCPETRVHPHWHTGSKGPGRWGAHVYPEED